MGAIMLHKKKFLIHLFFFISLILLGLALLFRQDRANHPTNPSSNWGRFLETSNYSGYKGVEYSARGFWKGDGLAEYHAWHYGPALTQRLISFFRRENATSILDLGGGAGLHVQEFIKQGFFASCYDGNPESQDISSGVCATMDLTKPMNLAKHDWVLSLKVGRQIPKMLQDEFIANVHNLNQKGVVMFWGDGKKVKESSKWLRNPKNNSEIKQIFAKLGYEYDEAATKFVQGSNISDLNYSVQVLKKIVVDDISPKEINSRISGSETEIFTSAEGYPNVGSDPEYINIALTSCGLDRMEEALTLVKSAIFFSQHTKLQALVFADSETILLFENKMNILAQESKKTNPNFKYRVLPTTFPPEIEGMTSWVEMFKPCSLQRLFLPTILPSVDALIYLDADSLILANLTDFWAHFSSMPPKAFVGVTQQTEPPAVSWFQVNKFPHYGVRGVNTGISLMNLTRMRNEGFFQLITKVRQHYEYLRPKETGDQFLQNVLYNFNPEFVSLIPCEWNLRPLHCRCEKVQHCSCQSAHENGAAVIHGTKNAFSDGARLPFFKNIYQAFQTYNFTTDTISTLLEGLATAFKYTENKTCNKNCSRNCCKGTCYFDTFSSFFKRTEKYVSNLQLL